jgi:hypothetical protein
MISLGKMWRRITVTRYTRALEAEVVRLRAENRALLNSILGIAGVPPITVPDSVAIGNGPAAIYGRPSRVQGEASCNTQMPAARSANGKTQGPNTVAAMRRRSWHQIYRMLEIDSARKKANPLGGQVVTDGSSSESTTSHSHL